MSQNLIIALAFALLLVILIVYEYSKKKSTSLLTPDNATLSATAGATTLPAATAAAPAATAAAPAATANVTPSKADVYNAIMADPDVLKSALATGMSKTEFIHEITVLSAAFAALSPSDYKSQVADYTTHHQAFSGVIWP